MAIKGQLISKKIVRLRILPKNEQMNLFLLVCDMFSFVFWENPRPEKRLTDLQCLQFSQKTNFVRIFALAYWGIYFFVCFLGELKHQKVPSKITDLYNEMGSISICGQTFVIFCPSAFALVAYCLHIYCKYFAAMHSENDGL